MSAKSVDAYSELELNDLLADVSFGDTMARLSSIYQDNAILAGLLADNTMKLILLRRSSKRL